MKSLLSLHPGRQTLCATYNERMFGVCKGNYTKGETICDYSGELYNYATFKQRHIKYNAPESGSYILEFKFKEKCWTIDATNEDNSLGWLIKHSWKLPNCRPIVGEDRGKPYVYFIANSDILPNNEVLYDYGDNSNVSKTYFPWLKVWLNCSLINCKFKK